MKFVLRPGVRNIKEASTARMRRVSPKRPIVQDVKKEKVIKKISEE